MKDLCDPPYAFDPAIAECLWFVSNPARPKKASRFGAGNEAGGDVVPWACPVNGRLASTGYLFATTVDGGVLALYFV